MPDSSHSLKILSAAFAATALLGLVGAARAQSDRPGMGSIPFEGGVTFRVWAPHATSVHVAGTFNGWSPDLSPLAAEGEGLWSADLGDARVGDHYRYVIRSSSGMVTRRDPYSRLVTTSHYTDGHSIIYDARAFRWNQPRLTPPPLDDLIIYEMHVGTFADVPGGGPGTFDTAILGLDHIASLGFTAVQVMPVNEFISRFSSGYNPSDLFAVHNRAYGGPDAFKRFVKACHARGLTVLLDVVYNHWGPWDLATHQFDGWSSPQYPGGIYFYDAGRINSPWGPRPNYAEPRVRQYIFDNLRMWVEEYRVGGFRWDSTSNIYDTSSGRGQRLPEGWSLLRQANDAMDRLAPRLIRIAEDLRNEDRLTAPVNEGGAGFNAQWHFFSVHLRQELARPNDADRNIDALRHAIRSTHNGDFLQRIIYTESHNEICCGAQRLTMMIDPQDPDGWAARKRSTLGTSILFTSPGIPMIYQGQEFVEQQPFDPRLPIEWSRREMHGGIVDLYRDLIALRRNTRGRTAGLRGTGLNVHHADNTAKVIAYHRWDAGGAGDDVIVAANFTAQPIEGRAIGFPHAGRWVARFNSDWRLYADDFGHYGSDAVMADGPPRDGMPHSAAVDIGAYTLIVFSQD